MGGPTDFWRDFLTDFWPATPLGGGVGGSIDFLKDFLTAVWPATPVGGSATAPGGSDGCPFGL